MIGFGGNPVRYVVAGLTADHGGRVAANTLSYRSTGSVLSIGLLLIKSIGRTLTKLDGRQNRDEVSAAE